MPFLKNSPHPIFDARVYFLCAINMKPRAASRTAKILNKNPILDFFLAQKELMRKILAISTRAIEMQGIPGEYWAKFTPESAERAVPASYLSLEDHLIDVATCFETLLSTGYDKPLARSARLDHLTPGQKHRLCTMAFLHDLGKAAVDFQRQIFQGENAQRRHRGHTAVCTFFLTADDSNSSFQTFKSSLPAGCFDWFFHDDDEDADAFCRMLLATWGHHGTPVDYSFIGGSDTNFEDVQWEGWRYADFTSLLSNLWSVIARYWPMAFEETPPIHATSAFMQEFNGLLQLADWIGSDKTMFGYESHQAKGFRRDFAVDAAKEFLDMTGKNSVATGRSVYEAFEYTPNPMQNDFLRISSELIQ